MKEIPLTQGYVALVDDEDYKRVSKYKWCLVDQRKKGRVYAKGYAAGKIVLMHRIILGVTDSAMKVDHKDGNGLNNQRSNLRICTNSQNQMNAKKRRGGTSKYKGVSWNSQYSKFRVVLDVDSKQYYIGRYTDELEAALAYDAAAREHFGEFALCNFPQKIPMLSTALPSHVPTCQPELSPSLHSTSQ